jgi:hypothetical protein
MASVRNILDRPIYLARSMDREVNYEIVLGPLLPHPCQAQIPSSASCPRALRRFGSGKFERHATYMF